MLRAIAAEAPAPPVPDPAVDLAVTYEDGAYRVAWFDGLRKHPFGPPIPHPRDASNVVAIMSGKELHR